MHFIKAVYNFVTLAQYRTYNKDTLSYIEDALRRIDTLKYVFKSFRLKKKDSKLIRHFNLLKLYALTY
jgi:hypothetical protein